LDRFIHPRHILGTRGGIIVTGSGVYTAAGNKVIKRDLTIGAVLWEKDITMSNGGSPLAADVDGNIFVVPFQNGVTKYGSAGNVLSVFSAISSQASDLDVDTAGNIYVVGSTVSSKSGSDILTQKYGQAGNLLWSTTMERPGSTRTRVSLSRCATDMFTWAEASTTRTWTCAR